MSRPRSASREPFPFELFHRVDVARDELDPAGCAAGVAAAPVHDVDPGVFDRQYELRSRLDLERLLPFDGHGWHTLGLSSPAARVFGSRSGIGPPQSEARPPAQADLPRRRLHVTSVSIPPR